MTGFGAAQTANHDLRVTLRAVNGRYFEPRFHLGKEWMALESELKKRLSKHISRGTIDVYIQSKATGSMSSSLKLNLNLAKDYLKAADKISKLKKTKESLSLEALMRMPSVIVMDESIEASPEQKKQLFRTFDQALQKLKSERLREGQSIQRDILIRLKSLTAITKKMTAYRSASNAELEAKLKQRLKQKSGENIDPSRLAQELIFYLDRNDIGEELSRLSEHISEFKKLLSFEGPVGKKLDFFSQELLREINTIGSKASLVNLTQAVVEAKTQLESIREQVQNIQ